MEEFNTLLQEIKQKIITRELPTHIAIIELNKALKLIEEYTSKDEETELYKNIPKSLKSKLQRLINKNEESKEKANHYRIKLFFYSMGINLELEEIRNVLGAS